MLRSVKFYKKNNSPASRGGRDYTSAQLPRISHQILHKQDDEYNIPVATPQSQIADKLLGCFQCQPPSKINSTLFLDCAYLITLGQNPNLHNLCRLLAKHSKSVIVLATDGGRLKDVEDTHTKVILFRSDLHAAYNRFKCNKNPSRHFINHFDIPSKRNYALQYSKSVNHNRVGIFDDDLLLTSTHISTGISSLSEGADIASFYSLQFPDVSTVDLVKCHLCSGNAEVSISGNAMFLNIARVQGFFPYVYNEDWLFFLHNLAIGNRLKGVGVIKQQPRMRVTTNRIMFEQFGELISDGLIITRQNNLVVLPEDMKFWTFVLAEYRSYLNNLLLYSDSDTCCRNIVRHAIHATHQFTPNQLVRFVVAFNNELDA